MTCCHVGESCYIIPEVYGIGCPDPFRVFLTGQKFQGSQGSQGSQFATIFSRRKGDGWSMSFLLNERDKVGDRRHGLDVLKIMVCFPNGKFGTWRTCIRDSVYLLGVRFNPSTHGWQRETILWANSLTLRNTMGHHGFERQTAFQAPILDGSLCSLRVV